jgi:hypothetical protein
MGLFNRVVPADRLMPTLMEEATFVALRMARLPAIAVKQNKDAIKAGRDGLAFLALRMCQ